MTSKLFLSAVENPGTPDLNMERLHVAYEWDLTLGKKQASQITTDDVRFWADKLPANAQATIDLEPGAGDAYTFNADISVGLYRMRQSAGRFSAFIKAAKTSVTNPTIGTLYVPFARNLWREPKMLSAAATLVDELMPVRPDTIDFDCYRSDPDRIENGMRAGSDARWDETIEDHLIEAGGRDSVLDGRRPLRVWMCPLRTRWTENGKPVMLPLTQFRSDLMRVASLLAPSAGDRIVIWFPRVKWNQSTISNIPWVWDAAWDWHTCLPGVERAVLG